MAKLIVIGAGVMGLAAAYHALIRGHDVDVFEADDRPGGMAAHFAFGGLSLERYYHFICKSDQPTFDLLDKLDIADRLRWRDTSMGYFIEGNHFRWGDPWSLLRFPLLGLMDKLRYGLQMFRTTQTRNFDHLDSVNAADWFIAGSGRRAFDLLWRRLLDLKFHQYAGDISASWIATRIKRIGNSRRSLRQEVLGYLDGGSEILVSALVTGIEKLGGRIHLGARAERIEVTNGSVRGVTVGGQEIAADAVICTVPTPYVADLVPALSQSAKERYRAIRNIGVVCVVLRLKRPVTRHFWLNISDSSIEIPGIIEFSNLRPFPDTIVYVPYYMPHDHAKWQWRDEDFIAECLACLRRLNPKIGPDDLIDSNVARLRYAQPICEPNFAAKLPSIRTEIEGLQIADTAFYYPEDRGIAESVRLARKLVEGLS